VVGLLVDGDAGAGEGDADRLAAEVVVTLGLRFVVAVADEEHGEVEVVVALLEVVDDDVVDEPVEPVLGCVLDPDDPAGRSRSRAA